MGKYNLYSTVFAFMAAVLWGFVVEFIIRLGEGYFSGVSDLILFNSATYRLLIIFALVGAFFLFVSWLFNREANKEAKDRDDKITKSLENIEILLAKLVKGGNKK